MIKANHRLTQKPHPFEHYLLVTSSLGILTSHWEDSMPSEHYLPLGSTTYLLQHRLSLQNTAYTVGALSILWGHIRSFGSTLHFGSTTYLLEHRLTFVSTASHRGPHPWLLLNFAGVSTGN